MKRSPPGYTGQEAVITVPPVKVSSEIRLIPCLRWAGADDDFLAFFLSGFRPGGCP
jgi:hypothetical protein